MRIDFYMIGETSGNIGHKEKGESEKTILQRQIDATDHQIDQLVYELYGLTKKEIQIVEEATKHVK